MWKRLRTLVSYLKFCVDFLKETLTFAEIESNDNEINMEDVAVQTLLEIVI